MPLDPNLLTEGMECLQTSYSVNSRVPYFAGAEARAGAVIFIKKRVRLAKKRDF